jgi:hypothetical protein
VSSSVLSGLKVHTCTWEHLPTVVANPPEGRSQERFAKTFYKEEYVGSTIRVCISPSAATSDLFEAPSVAKTPRKSLSLGAIIEGQGVLPSGIRISKPRGKGAMIFFLRRWALARRRQFLKAPWRFTRG